MDLPLETLSDELSDLIPLKASRSFPMISKKSFSHDSHDLLLLISFLILIQVIVGMYENKSKRPPSPYIL